MSHVKGKNNHIFAPQTIYLYVGVVAPHGIFSMVASSTATPNTPTSRYFTASTSRYLSLDHETQDTSHTCSRKQPPILFYPFQCQESTFSTSHTHKDVIHLKIYLTLLFFFLHAFPNHIPNQPLIEQTIMNKPYSFYITFQSTSPYIQFGIMHI